uniref:Uncharacterized protein n=1 Tax=Cyanistes caeruleus TaxID=156563 RepID=A0A8C0UES3_CYACU
MAGTPSTIPACSKPHPAWPWALPGSQGQPQILWKNFARASPPSQERVSAVFNLNSPSLSMKTFPILLSLQFLMRSPSPAFMQLLQILGGAVRSPQNLLFFGLNSPKFLTNHGQVHTSGSTSAPLLTAFLVQASQPCTNSTSNQPGMCQIHRNRANPSVPKSFCPTQKAGVESAGFRLCGCKEHSNLEGVQTQPSPC